ncbi:hypothetical protein [Bradyrhizobium sp. 174]|uniref:hypothetical protein n=1 Tax=Bradyrhizobium sp. 174 TaxID=2782645 RepID=UPI001FF948C8
MEALTHQLRRVSCFANPTESKIELAELLCGRIPRIDRVRFVNTGSEAVLFAIKAARAFSGAEQSGFFGFWNESSGHFASNAGSLRSPRWHSKQCER